MNDFLPILQAGGTAAVPVVLYVGIRYLANQLDSARQEAKAAHETTVAILTDCIRDNTVAMHDVKSAIAGCRESTDRNHVAVALAYPRRDTPEDRQ